MNIFLNCFCYIFIIVYLTGRGACGICEGVPLLVPHLLPDRLPEGVGGLAELGVEPAVDELLGARAVDADPVGGDDVRVLLPHVLARRRVRHERQHGDGVGGQGGPRLAEGLPPGFSFQIFSQKFITFS